MNHLQRGIASFFAILIVFQIVLLLPAYSVPSDLNHADVTVYTHNHYPTSLSDDVWEVYEERSALILQALDVYYYSAYGLYPIAPSTAKYNCHSYAWYDRSSTNIIWINNPIAFVTDATPITASNVQPGDIVVYTEQGDIIHSAVVESISGGELVLVSKWGEAGLYRHTLYQNPYSPPDVQSDVSYYRIECKYNHYYTDLGRTKHQATCWCGNSIVEEHSMIASGNLFVCSKCGHSVEMWSNEPVTE